MNIEELKAKYDEIIKSEREMNAKLEERVKRLEHIVVELEFLLDKAKNGEAL